MSLALEWKGSAYPARGREGRAREKEDHRGHGSPERTRRVRLTFICFVCVAAAVSGLLILTICLHVAVVQNEMRVREVERQIDLERRQQEGIRVEIASLESPARIEKIAVEAMKMVQSLQAEYLETPAYQAARQQEREKRLSHEEGMVSDAGPGGR